MNTQTPGPLKWQGTMGRPKSLAYLSSPEGFVLHTESDPESANAALLAAAYTSYDKAGRELGVDATTLAQTVDLAALVRVIQDVATQPFVYGCSSQSMLRGIHDMQGRLRAVLSKLPAPLPRN